MFNQKPIIMELRKNPKIDLEKKRGLFFNIGLATSLLIVISAFEWRFYGEGPLVLEYDMDCEFEDAIEIPPTVIPPPPKPKIEMPIIVEAPKDEQLLDEPDFEIDVEIDNDPIADLPLPPLTVEPVVEPLIVAEKMPEPIGGYEAFWKYLSKSINYPQQARRMGIEGKVFVQFVIDKDGSLTEMIIVKGIGGGCDEEAIRVLADAPKWNPGKQRGIPVKVKMTLPVIYRLR